MCGIFGLFVSKDASFDSAVINQSLAKLASLSESRGKDSSGLVFRRNVDRAFHIVKGDVYLNYLLKRDEVNEQMKQMLGKDSGSGSPRDTFAVMGHSRLVTNGSQMKDVNNQPVIKNGVIGIHNGIIVNDNVLWSCHPDIEQSFGIDTEVMLALIRKYLKDGWDVVTAISKTLTEVFGTVSSAFLFDDLNVLALTTNNGSLYALDNGKGYFAFASEEFFLQELIRTVKLDANAFSIRQVLPGEGVILDLDSFQVRTFSFADPEKELPADSLMAPPFAISAQTVSDGRRQRELVLDPATIARNPNATREADLLEFNEERINALRRCTKCLLPESFPFIHYDGDGVCNYCNNYRIKNKPKPVDELFALVEPYRSKDGSPDCIIPFSGGRDSTFTLHVVKNVLKLNPIAFTYDWGMVTDLARRNIARVCGKLGVENILVSADIWWKRENIRKNILAWLHKPNLGMIPLFMAGDKYFYYYTDQVKRQTGLRLNIWGINPLENTDFKVGFLGVPPDHEKERIYSLSANRQMTLFANVAKSVLGNHRYINGSILDTMGSFLVRMVVPHKDYYHMFDYYRWDEAEIDSLVLDEYKWETAIDTKTTWRIGDGTAAFYNYVYYTVAGFSEYDTFRSNQIREGMLTREEGMKLVMQENRPRYANIKWYSDVLNLDYESTIRTINNIPKLYR